MDPENGSDNQIGAILVNASYYCVGAILIGTIFSVAGAILAKCFLLLCLSCFDQNGFSIVGAILGIII